MLLYLCSAFEDSISLHIEELLNYLRDLWRNRFTYFLSSGKPNKTVAPSKESNRGSYYRYSFACCQVDLVGFRRFVLAVVEIVVAVVAVVAVVDPVVVEPRLVSRPRVCLLPHRQLARVV
jgi:hypothetical protein